MGERRRYAWREGLEVMQPREARRRFVGREARATSQSWRAGLRHCDEPSREKAWPAEHR